MFLEATGVTIISLIIGFFIGKLYAKGKETEQIRAAEQKSADLAEITISLSEKSELINEQQVELQENKTSLAVMEQKLKSSEDVLVSARQEQAEVERKLKIEQEVLVEKLQALSSKEASLQAVNRQNTERLQAIDTLKNELKAEKEKTTQVESERNELTEGIATVNANLQAITGQSVERSEDISQLKKEAQQSQKKITLLEDERSLLREELATVNTSIEKERKHAEAQITLLNENKEVLKQEFQLLSQKIFKESSSHFSEQNKESLNFLLKPFKEQLDSFRKRVDEVHTHQAEGQASLSKELDTLFKLNQKITDEASNLTKALTNDKKTQGNWGEIQVEMILEQSGLLKGNEYEREANFKDDEGNNKRPDFIIHLPDGKHIIIDSKVSLVDYNRYVAAENDSEREAALNQHVKAIKNHINSLSEKGYSKLEGMQSPDFVFMFMPIEPAFLVAFHFDQGLFNTAFEKRIVVVTPSTLLATVRTVASLWSIERQNQSARILADQAGKVYDKLRVFVEKMDKLGAQITTARNTYDDARNTLVGSRSLVSTVDKFVELGVRVKKELPASVKDASTLDDDTISQIE